MECNVSTNSNVSRNYTEEERTCYLAHLQLNSTYTMIPAIIFLGVLCFVGIIGNSIVLFVYSQRFRSTASGTFIMAIAVFDLLTNIILIPGDIHAMFHHWDFVMVYPCKLRLYGHAVTHGASSFFLVALAVTRYRKICKPFSSQVSVKQARLSCIGLWILAMPPTRSPDGMTINQSSTRNKALSRSCDYVDRVPSADKSSWAQMNYPSILKNQNIYRKIQDSSLQQRSQLDSEFALKFRMLPVLAFVAMNTRVMPLKNYRKFSPLKQCRLQTVSRTTILADHNVDVGDNLFPVDMWNMQTRVEDHMPKLNNSFEGWPL
ncbi:cysteinyl leukotriene receptor 1-like [Physella acuta]|uniref:cysteinyl leukotriene receptor 1-like n=1 Tax=Physella acuta TaxID=109671 RepID=UPI0027DBC2B5|nr:cysteinyl leukotriene receptor 1-like [Physella acuta]